MGEVNKLLGRSFLIGFFLPAFSFLVALSFSLNAVGIHKAWLTVNPDEPLKETAIFVIMSLGFAIFLQSINRELFRMLEGYWGPGLQGIFSRCQKWRFRKLHRQIADLKVTRDAYQKENPGKRFPRLEEYNRLCKRAADSFPHREDLVLPTNFGNTVRAYEDYPRVMYGFESISGWSRIQPLFSKQAVEILGDTRARVDLWLNTCFLSWVTLLLNFVFALSSKDTDLIPAVVVCIAVFALAYWRVCRSAERYGDTVKGLYDIYLPNLAKKLGFQLSDRVEENRKFWQAFSVAIVYRDAESIQDMAYTFAKRIPIASEKDKGNEGEKED